MNRFAMFFAGLLLMSSMTGCCLTHGFGTGFRGFSGGGCNSCGGACGVPPGGAFPSAFAPNGGQTAFAAPIGTNTAYVPGYPQTAFAPGYPQTAFIDPLPTY